jgi:hypothetical protein
MRRHERDDERKLAGSGDWSEPASPTPSTLLLKEFLLETPYCKVEPVVVQLLPCVNLP